MGRNASRLTHRLVAGAVLFDPDDDDLNFVDAVLGDCCLPVALRVERGVACGLGVTDAHEQHVSVGRPYENYFRVASVEFHFEIPAMQARGAR